MEASRKPTTPPPKARAVCSSTPPAPGEASSRCVKLEAELEDANDARSQADKMVEALRTEIERLCVF